MGRAMKDPDFESLVLGGKSNQAKPKHSQVNLENSVDHWHGIIAGNTTTSVRQPVPDRWLD
jgi:hypothetical protein